MKRFYSSEIQYKISVFIINREGFGTYNGVIYPGLIGKHCRKETTKKLKSIPRIFDELYSMVNDEFSVSLDEIIHLEIVNDGFTLSLDESDCGLVSAELSRNFNDGLIINFDSTEPGDFKFVNSYGKLRYVTPVALHHPDIDAVTGGKGVNVPVDYSCINYLIRVGAMTGTKSNIPLKLIVDIGRVPNYGISLPAISGFFKSGVMDVENFHINDIARREYECRRTTKYIPGRVYHQYRDNYRCGSGYRDLLYLGTFRNIITRAEGEDGERSVAFFKHGSIYGQGDLEVSKLVHVFLDVTIYYLDYIPLQDILSGVLRYHLYNHESGKKYIDIFPSLYRDNKKPYLIPSDRTIDLPLGDIESKVIDLALDHISPCWGDSKLNLYYDPYDGGHVKCLTELGFQYLPLVYSKLTREQKDRAIEVVSYFMSDEVVKSIHTLTDEEMCSYINGIKDYVNVLQ